MSKKIILVTLTAVFTGCMKYQSDSASVADTATQSVGCENFQSKVFDATYEYLDGRSASVDSEQVNLALADKIDELVQARKITDQDGVKEYKTQFKKVIDLMLDKSRQTKPTASNKEHLQLLIEMEMQDQSTVENQKLNNQVQTEFAALKDLSAKLDLKCEDPNAGGSSGTGGTTPPASGSMKRMVASMNNVFSTAYQSCDVLNVPEMTRTTPNVDGIIRNGTHSDGVGGKRYVSDLGALQMTHPYVKRAGTQTNSSCFAVKDHPLIYDYGGEPGVSTTTIDLFVNKGTGTEVLGVDCSALVSTVVSAGGLRYKPGLENKPIFIRQTSTKFISAQNSNFTCFSNVNVTPSTTIKSGDIAAVVGHVVMVDRVGSDPFGINKISKIEDCANVSSSQFDFSVMQSSPSKNGVGINRYIAKDYLNESGKMKTMFVEYAKASCRAKFNGQTISPRSSDWGIIRHKGTSECVTQNIKLAKQSCVSSCQKSF